MGDRGFAALSCVDKPNLSPIIMDVKVHISIFRVILKMNSNQSAPLPVVVVGGGISGLAAAHRLVELDSALPIRLLEAGSRLGGVLDTKSEQGFLWEAAADGFHGGAHGLRSLCEQLGLANEILPAATCAEPLQIVHRQKLVPSPVSIVTGSPPCIRSILTTPLLSLRGKCRLFGERWIAPDHTEDESCASFFTRRFGVEFYARLVEPVLSGIYSADPARLSMQALLPHLPEMERQCGSLTAAFRRRDADARTGIKQAGGEGQTAWTLRRGLSSLTTALAARLPAGAIKLSSPVHRLQMADDGIWNIDYGHGQTMNAAALILATPAYRAAHLLESVTPQVARLLQHISYSSIAVIALGYRRAQVGGPLTSLGVFVPDTEPFELRSASVTSLKYKGRAPVDTVLIRASLDGDHHASVVGQSDGELIELANDELSRLFQIDGPPLFARVQRQMFAIPQYRLGHRELIEAVRRRLADVPGIALAGNAYAGIGVPYCIASGHKAAEQISAYLHTQPDLDSPRAILKLRSPIHAEPSHA
jgi:oxygen-dependent protoporphyrinogen oxidase